MEQTLPPSPETGTLSAPRPSWVIPAFLAAVAVVVLLAYGLGASSRGQRDIGPAPDFTLQTFDGETLQLAAYRGTPVVINFWASWCVECRREAALLEQTWQRYKGEVLFIGVDYIDTEAEALAYLAEYQITYPNGPDLGSRIAHAYRIKGVPETYFVDRNGDLQGVQIGPLTQAELEGWIAQIRP